MDLCIIPSYWRSEFLYLALEAIYAADDSHDKHIRVYQDLKSGDPERFADDIKDTSEVLNYWKRGLGSRLQTILRQENTYYGNSFNVLEAYKKAYSEDWRLVHLIEDDVLISQDYFLWQQDMQVNDFFATIAGQTTRCPQMEYWCPSGFSGPTSFYDSEVYASLGVCWRRENLSWTVDHAVPAYYQNPTMHILKHFKGSKLGLSMMEQDGLIQRLAEQQFLKFAWSVPTRAYHVGVYGYHRGIAVEHMPEGSLSERIETLRKNISSPEWFKKVAGFQTDLQAIPNLTSQQ